jgi:hypothetical protein
MIYFKIKCFRRASKGAVDDIVFELHCDIENTKKMEARLALTGTAVNPLLVMYYVINKLTNITKLQFRQNYKINDLDLISK